jgi:hypothetical protein
MHLEMSQAEIKIGTPWDACGGVVSRHRRASALGHMQTSWWATDLVR